jgi:hypothetical protein
MFFLWAIVYDLQMKKNNKFIMLSLLFVMACASKPSFSPEISGAGGKYSPGGVVYSIPVKHPVIKMKLINLGIDKDNNLLVRMYFLRKDESASEYLDPREQAIILPDSKTEILPTKVHASVEGKPLIKLSDATKQSVEFLFPLPKGGHQYPYIKLNWKLHYLQLASEQTMAETERFDLVQKDDKDQKGVGSYYGDLEFPYGGYAPLPAEWVTDGWMWW